MEDDLLAYDDIYELVNTQNEVKEDNKSLRRSKRLSSLTPAKTKKFKRGWIVVESDEEEDEKTLAENDDSSGLSDSERETIMSRLYHGMFVPGATNGTRKRKLRANGTNGDYKSTFNIDLDITPAQPSPTVIETTTIDSDDDFTVLTSSLSSLT
jgi:hypothetical protein